MDEGGKTMKNWKDDLFNRNHYDWTDKEFKKWKINNRKHIIHFMDGRKDYKRSVRSISDIMFAHRMDKLKLLKLNPIEQSKRANELWKKHLKRIK